MSRVWIGLVMMLPGLAWAQTFESREDRFVLIDSAPPVIGDLVYRQDRQDPDKRLSYSKEEFRFETDTHIIVTHLSKVACGAPERLSDFHIMAIQYLPRVPTSFRDATRHDYYKEVYVRDEAQRLRLYEDVTGMQMVELAERFQPDCVNL
jgi:hypothetical protein